MSNDIKSSRKKRLFELLSFYSKKTAREIPKAVSINTNYALKV